jgi:hypothetical protein
MPDARRIQQDHRPQLPHCRSDRQNSPEIDPSQAQCDAFGKIEKTKRKSLLAMVESMVPVKRSKGQS